LLADTPGRARLSQLARALFDAGSAPYRLGRHTLALQPSIGIALQAEAGAHSTQALLRNANAALQRARKEQTGHAFFEPPPADA
jgi:predicted signal transduction protein with EAL and GGDEF domain